MAPSSALQLPVQHELDVTQLKFCRRLELDYIAVCVSFPFLGQPPGINQSTVFSCEAHNVKGLSSSRTATVQIKGERMGTGDGFALWGGKEGLPNARGRLEAASKQRWLELPAAEIMLCALLATPACCAGLYPRLLEIKLI